MGPAVEDDAVLERDKQVKPIALYGLPACSDSGGGPSGSAEAVEQREGAQEGHHRAR